MERVRLFGTALEELLVVEEEDEDVLTREDDDDDTEDIELDEAEDEVANVVVEELGDAVDVVVVTTEEVVDLPEREKATPIPAIIMTMIMTITAMVRLTAEIRSFMIRVIILEDLRNC